MKLVSKGIVYDWVSIELTMHNDSRMQSRRIFLAERKEVSKAIIYDWVYLELTVHTDSDVKYKDIGSLCEVGFEWHRL